MPELPRESPAPPVMAERSQDALPAPVMSRKSALDTVSVPLAVRVRGELNAFDRTKRRLVAELPFNVSAPVNVLFPSNTIASVLAAVPVLVRLFTTVFPAVLFRVAVPEPVNFTVPYVNAFPVKVTLAPCNSNVADDDVCVPPIVETVKPPVATIMVAVPKVLVPIPVAWEYPPIVCVNPELSAAPSQWSVPEVNVTVAADVMASTRTKSDVEPTKVRPPTVLVPKVIVCWVEDVVENEIEDVDALPSV